MFIFQIFCIDTFLIQLQNIFLLKIPKQDTTDNEVKGIPMTSSDEQLDFSTTHMAMETPNRKFASTPSNMDSQWSELALDFQNGSADSDDEGKKKSSHM